MFNFLRDGFPMRGKPLKRFWPRSPPTPCWSRVLMKGPSAKAIRSKS